MVNAIPIVSKGKVLALYIPKETRPDGLNFYSNPCDGLQFATYLGKRGYAIEPHIHLDRTAVIREVNEVIYIEKGMVKVDLYGDGKTTLFSQVLRRGDTIALIHGGHGFKFIRKSTLVYVKQGAYVSKELDKRPV